MLDQMETGIWRVFSFLDVPPLGSIGFCWTEVEDTPQKGLSMEEGKGMVSMLDWDEGESSKKVADRASWCLVVEAALQVTVDFLAAVVGSPVPT